jgi:hypothetical protein
MNPGFILMKKFIFLSGLMNAEHWNVAAEGRAEGVAKVWGANVSSQDKNQFIMQMGDPSILILTERTAKHPYFFIVLKSVLKK